MFRILLYIGLGTLALLFIWRFLFVGRPHIYTGLSKQDLYQYFKHLFDSALANRGTVHIKADGIPVAVNITKREYARKPSTVHITLSSGYVDRRDISTIAAYFSEQHIEHSLHFTNGRGALHRMTIVISLERSPIAHSVVNILDSMLTALGFHGETSFTIHVYGPIKYGYTTEDGVVVKRTINYSIGWVFGYSIGTLRRWLRGT